MTLQIRKEVKELCCKLRNTDSKTNPQEFKRLQDILTGKWKFTPWNLLALWENPPTIEYNDDNFGLIMAEKGERK